MASLSPVAHGVDPRNGSRRYLMCRPSYFEVCYAINPWMDPTVRVDTALAVRQWENLVHAYRKLGHTVELLDPAPDLPDMVFTANGAFVLDGQALGSRFANPVREPEAELHRRRLKEEAIDVVVPDHDVEGEGDIAWTGALAIAASGFRSAPHTADTVTRVFGVPALAVELVDPRFYHLDTALCVLDRSTIAWYPPAFSAASQQDIRSRFTTIDATEDDALVLGLNAVSDGVHVVLAEQAKTLAAQVRTAGFEPVEVDVSELKKSGGGIKCATAEWHTTVVRE